MALLWKKMTNNTLYEVRTAGNSLRLYRNGVFHTQYHPTQLFTGSVWDLLSIPTLLYQCQDIKRILVLGVGGGTVISQLNHFISPHKIVGIELDAIHLSVAKRFFDLDKKNIELINQDAKKWLSNFRGAKFDIIIDDLFGEHDGEPTRAIEANSDWFNLLLCALSPDGMIIQNHEDYQSLRKCAFYNNAIVRRNFKSAFRLCSPTLENNVAVFCRRQADKHNMVVNLDSLKNLSVSVNRRKLDYSIHNLQIVKF